MKDRIRSIMTQMGLSQQEFASRLGLTPASISGIFNGRTNPTMNHARAIRQAFPQINTDWLLYGEGEMMGGSTPTPQVADPGISIIDDEQDDSNLGGIFNHPSQTATPASPNVQSIQVSTTPLTSPNPAQRGQVARSETGRNAHTEITKNFDKPLRRVKEIRVFYDDNTYETFIPAVK